MAGKLQNRLFPIYLGISKLRLAIHGYYSPSGKLIVIFIFLSSGFGFDTSATLAHQMVALLTALLCFSLMSLWRKKRVYQVSRSISPLAYTDIPITYKIDIHNHEHKHLLGLFAQDSIEHNWPSKDEYLAYRCKRVMNSFDAAFGYLKWIDFMNLKKSYNNELKPIQIGPDGQMNREITFLRRGKFTFGPMYFFKEDLFGLLRSKTKSQLNHKSDSVLVLPQRIPLPKLTLPGQQKNHPGGESLAHSISQSEEFISLRDYRPGDPIKHIHWKSSARTGNMVCKEYQDENYYRYALALNNHILPGQEELFECAISIATSFTYALDSHESFLDLLFMQNGFHCISSGRGIGHIREALEALACIQANQRDDFSELSTLIEDKIHLMSSCILVTLIWSKEQHKLISSLLAKQIPVKVIWVREQKEPSPDFGPLKSHPQDLLQVSPDNPALDLQGLS
ncbi:MAG: DUF58 domain-containing protein [Planctomycetes bacterium]|nr:DUF58 domain-containing protein [Planctomycetota bacterium]